MASQFKVLKLHGSGGRGAASIGATIVLAAALIAFGLASPAYSAQPEEHPYSRDHVLVKLQPGFQADQVLGSGSEVVFGRWRVQPVPRGRSLEEFVDRLESRSGVEEVELDHLMELDPVEGDLFNSSSVTSLAAINDPYFSYQWHFPAIQLEEAWATSTGAGVVVAIVDSGISRAGEDLDCHSFVAPYNAITRTTGLTAANDDNGHGTHVAGTVAQCTDNGVGVAGVAFDADLMPVKVLNSEGSGWVSDIVHGIDWARTHNADVLNLSLGGPSSSSIMDDAIATAVGEGIVVVAASGNDGVEPVLYPARHADVIAVGATDVNNDVTPYSNRGSALDLVAPGGLVINSDGEFGILQETVCFASASECRPSLGGGNGWDYYFFQGTSMATPHVSGAAALLRSIEPRLAGAGARSILETSALDLGPSGFDTSYGHGLIQLDDAIELLNAPDASVPSWPGGAELIGDLVAGDSVELTWPDANDNKAVVGYRIYRNGSLVETTGASQTSTLVTGLASATDYKFSARAEDLDRNLSDPLLAEVTTPDTTSPRWGSAADLFVKEYGERHLILGWSGATDNAGVTGYRLRLSGTTGFVTSDQQFTVTGLQPGTPYLFEVLARDAAGNWSEILSRTLRTARAFTDTPGTTFYNDILWMSGEDITRSCNPPVNDMFCPDDPVTRGQMAAFVVRALGLALDDHPGFVDVPEDSTFAADIGRLATAGITRGCNPPVNDRFCPNDPVTRGQFAAFFHRGLG